MKPFAVAALLALAACGSSGAETGDRSGDDAKSLAAGPCVNAVFEGSRFTHCIVDPAKADIALRLDGADGIPMRSFTRLAEQRPGESPIMAMNGGMFNEAGNPIGLYVESGEQRVALNTNEGPGNFHLMPNGVFWGGNGVAHVDTTEHFATLEPANPPPFATQSGPMLVVDGKLHPQFAADGESKHFRNGVGVDKAGKVHFVISDDLVSFGRFGRFFRDEAKTPDALYLDGAVSALWDPAGGRKDGGPPLGPLIVVTKQAKAG